MAKFKEKLKVQNLRKEGYSVRYITNLLKVSKSSVSIWCRDIQLTEAQQRILVKKQKSGMLKAQLKAAELKRKNRLDSTEVQRQKGIAEVGELTDREFFTAGIGIYWGEGSKGEGSTSIANSDPQVIIFMIEWFKRFAEVKKSDFACQLSINEIYIDQTDKIEKYWSKTIGIPLNQFTKASIKHVNNKKTYLNSKIHIGTLRLQIYKSTNLRRRILGWIEGLAKAA